MINELAEYIQRHKDFDETKPQPAHISLYLVERAYGGPEEGGWWYDVYEFIGSIPLGSEEKAKKWLKAAEKKAKAMTLEIDRSRAYDSLGDDDTVSSSYPEGYIPTGWSDGGEYLVLIEAIPGFKDNTKEPKPMWC